MNSGVSCLYTGTVMHHRVRPKKHRLNYRVFSMLLNLDELEHLSKRLKLFSFNNFNVFSFHNKDHGLRTDIPLRQWVDAQLSLAGINLNGGAVHLLCYPRIFGYAFNPLSVYFCYDSESRLTATLYEVRNTFGQSHIYLIRVDDQDSKVIRQSCSKNLFVSPFIEMGATYNFRIQPPTNSVTVAINESDKQGKFLFASFTGNRIPLTDRKLLRMVFAYPLMTLKVIAGIHWEALKLWRKGVPLAHRPEAPTKPVSVITN